MINTGLGEEKVTAFTLENILVPVLFVVLGVFVLVFVIVYSIKNNNK